MTVFLVLLFAVIFAAWLWAIIKPLGEMADGWKKQEDDMRAESHRIRRRTLLIELEIEDREREIERCREKLELTRLR